MNSGIRVPYHLEVAETQRIAAKQDEYFMIETEKKTVLLEEGKITQEQFDKFMIKLDEKRNAVVKQLNQLTSGELEAEQGEKVKNELLMTNATANDSLTDDSNRISMTAISKDAFKDLPTFVRTPSNPPSLANFENLKNMPMVPRYDAFYNPPLVPLTPFKFSYRWKYLSFFKVRALGITEFMNVDPDQATCIAVSYRHPHSGTMVTLLPVVHAAHPSFWRQCDEICSQHHSVLMEGRYSPMSTDISVIPPREKFNDARPEDEIDSEGWEPPAGEHLRRFRQPYSWGVASSDQHTIIHAADSYDYDKLPVWARLRWNVPFIGAYQREKHCLNVLYQLSQNGYESFAIPWGAAHMPIFAKMLLENGFEKASATRVVLFNRVDGPVSAAYTRKLGAYVGREFYFRQGMNIFGGIFVVWAIFSYLGWDKKDIVMFNDTDGAKFENRGRDEAARRAWDKAMEPTTAQQRARAIQ